MRLLAALSLAFAVAWSWAQGDRQEPGALDRGARDSVSKPEASSMETSQDRDSARCAKLEGELREQCLRDLGAGAGASVPPKAGPPTAVQRDPVTEPPPQNPRQPR